jgi:hypothetical protein
VIFTSEVHMPYDGNLRKWEKNQTQQVIPNTGGTVVTRFGPWDLSNLHRKTLTMFSYGPATFTMGNIEVSADGAIWGTLDATTIPTFGSGALSRIYQLDSIKWWRINTCVAAGSVATFSYWWSF